MLNQNYGFCNKCDAQSVHYCKICNNPIYTKLGEILENPICSKCQEQPHSINKKIINKSKWNGKPDNDGWVMIGKEKYGRYMQNINTGEIRNLTFDEFYKNSVVD
jgi:DNA-directed RNA polymerase subunit M/transcription elongation factor TFIIS